MRYLTVYTLGFAAMLGIGLAYPTPALTDIVLFAGSHLVGLCIACGIWCMEVGERLATERRMLQS